MTSAATTASRPTLQEASADTGVRPRRWTREEYYRAAELGLFRPEERLELIGGEVIEHVSPQRTPHTTALYAATEALEAAFGTGFSVRTQSPMTLDDGSEPEPDVLVVRGSWRDYAARHPGPDDVRLLAEVSDTTLAQDRVRKASLYAAAGIPDYWIINLVDRRLEVYRRPGPLPDAPFGSAYRSVTIYTEGERAAPHLAPESSVPVGDLFPPIPPPSEG